MTRPDERRTLIRSDATAAMREIAARNRTLYRLVVKMLAHFHLTIDECAGVWLAAAADPARALVCYAAIARSLEAR